MKLLIVGVASLFCLAGCGSEVVVGDQGGGSGPGGASASGASSGGAASGASSGGASNRWSDPTSDPDCSVSPASLQTYSTLQELDQLLVGQWRRCIAPQIPGEDIGVEFTADGKYYPLTSNEAQEVVRRTGVDYEGTWEYTPAGAEDPISHQPATRALIQLSGVTTDAPQFTNDPRQLRIFFSPVPGKYLPLVR